MQVNVADIIGLFHTQLDELYGPNEVESFARLALEHHSGVPYASYTSHKSKVLDEKILPIYQEVTTRLQNHEPIQHILGVAWFYGLAFKVTPDTLIPRPETEELVEMVLKENPLANLRIADICTGSGCIGITIKHNKPGAEVWATDFSLGALAVAKENAANLKEDVKILEHDALSGDYTALTGDWDVWVSNPPYVKLSEKQGLAPHVLNFEPHTALFVPDSDALLFYRHIAQAGLTKLKPGGRLYFEVHTHHATEVANLLLALGYKSCKIVKDIYGRDRIVAAEKE